MPIRQRHAAISHSLFQLEREGLLVPMQARIEGSNPYSGNDVSDFVCPLGNSAIVDYFLQQSRATLKTNCSVESIESTSNNQFIVQSGSSGVTESNVDVVVLTMPIPLIDGIRLNGLLAEERAKMRTMHPVEYSSRYALALFFPDRCDVGLDFGFRFLDDDILRYIEVDNIKRNQRDKPSAVVMHSTWQFGQKHLQSSLLEAEKLMLERFHIVFPSVPRTDFRKIHQWRYSQVRTQKEGSERLGYCDLRNQTGFLPGVFCAGDGFTFSSMDGCFESASQVCEAIFKRISDR
ncbi:renalase-like isoform X2 [Paramacrobiotus metropolitanus]|uniref:renalase-like isoform X2 n=1 Tax=Paramacrobiotus metropolitanus TaxID=2943436 RepID=UPI002445BD0A|nr:renalase-like isoform X2 [Paramacrobiotus metropolitanus]